MKLNTKGFSFAAMAILVVAIVMLCFVGWQVAATKHTSDTKGTSSDQLTGGKGRKVLFTTIEPMVGGTCNYAVFESTGKRATGCVDDKSLAAVIQDLKKQNPTQKSYDDRKLIKVDAEVHMITERRSPTTSTPQYTDVELYVIDKVYSAELTSIEMQYN